jgi:hypothetical protein
MTPGTKSGGGAEKDKHKAENDKNSAENDEIKVPKKSAETGGNLLYIFNTSKHVIKSETNKHKPLKRTLYLLGR